MGGWMCWPGDRCLWRSTVPRPPPHYPPPRGGDCGLPGPRGQRPPRRPSPSSSQVIQSGELAELGRGGGVVCQRRIKLTVERPEMALSPIAMAARNIALISVVPADTLEPRRRPTPETQLGQVRAILAPRRDPQVLAPTVERVQILEVHHPAARYRLPTQAEHHPVKVRKPTPTAARQPRLRITRGDVAQVPASRQAAQQSVIVVVHQGVEALCKLDRPTAGEHGQSQRRPRGPAHNIPPLWRGG